MGASATVAGLAALAACRERGVPLEPSGSPPAASATQPRIEVVGAGLAGLTCAYRLQQAGLPCTVHEADGIPGGRVRTLRGYFADGQLGESGGEFVDSRHTALWQLVAELGLELDDLWLAAPIGAEVFRLAGRRYSMARADEEWRVVFDAVQADVAAAGADPRFDGSTKAARRIDRTSAAEWIDATIPGGGASPLGELLDVIWTTESGADTGDLSALTLVRALAESPRVAFWPVGDSDQRYHVRGGNDQVVTRMAERLPEGSLHTGSALVALRARDDGGLACTFEEDGRLADVRCDRVVLALPFTALREVDTAAAGFRLLKQQAISELPLGTSSKLHLEFRRRAWLDQGLSGWTQTTRLQTTWEETVAQPGDGGVLVVYNGGSAGAGWQPAPAHGPADVDTAAAAIGVLDGLVSGLRAAWTGRAWLDFWRASPWHHGAYSFYGVGQTTRFRGIEGLREGNVHFAGEHTSLAFRGYMEGAVESGERVAMEILADHGQA